MNLIPLVLTTGMFVTAVAITIARPPIPRTVRIVTVTITADTSRLIAAFEALDAAFSRFGRSLRRPPVPPLIQWPNPENPR